MQNMDTYRYINIRFSYAFSAYHFRHCLPFIISRIPFSIFPHMHSHTENPDPSKYLWRKKPGKCFPVQEIKTDSKGGSIGYLGIAGILGI